MAAKQGDLALLEDPIAQQLLTSANMAHLAYAAPDGSPRVVPMWFHWDGEEIVMGSPPTAPKVKMLMENPRVAVEIDSYEWPYRVLIVRGTAKVELVDGVTPEYTASAERFFGAEPGRAWAVELGTMFSQMARIAVRPEWVGILDHEARFPSALAPKLQAKA